MIHLHVPVYSLMFVLHFGLYVKIQKHVSKNKSNVNVTITNVGSIIN